MAHTKLWYFERFGLLQGLSTAQRQEIERKTRMITARRGESIFLPGDHSNEVFIVKSGSVKILGQSPEGGEVISALLGPGDVFGELAIVDPGPQGHRAQAADDTLLCAIPRELLVRLIHEAPAFGFKVTKLIGLRLKTLRTRVDELLGKSASSRLAHALRELGREHGVRDDQGVLIPLRLSQGDLGKLVGLTRETVNGIVHGWREQGLIEMDRRSIRLRDPDRLH
jgi:CRP/FNR family transcriptional regulator, cyclic AMP receptor protein